MPRFQHLVSTVATKSRCRLCRRPTLTALDSGLPAVVDPEPVDAAAELAALMAGRWTYARLPGGGLAHRDAGRIAAGFTGAGIHVEHQCPAGAVR